MSLKPIHRDPHQRRLEPAPVHQPKEPESWGDWLYRIISEIFAWLCFWDSDSTLEDRDIEHVQTIGHVAAVAQRHLHQDRSLESIKRAHAHLSRKQFVGVDGLIEIHTAQVREFRRMSFQAIRDAHYDWWAFPVYPYRGRDGREKGTNGHGLKYSLTPDAVRQLKSNQGFMRRYKEGISRVLAAYGWNTQTNSSPQGLQKIWSVRLNKILTSARIFLDEQDPIRQSLTLYELHARSINKIFG